MKKAAAITTGISALVVGGLVALAAPAVAGVYTQVSSWQTVTGVPSLQAGTDRSATAPGASPTPLPGDDVNVGGVSIPVNDPGGCDKPAWLQLGRASASLNRDLIDSGPREYAAGTAGLDDQGRVVTYTVAAGEADVIRHALAVGDLVALRQMFA